MNQIEPNVEPFPVKNLLEVPDQDTEQRYLVDGIIPEQGCGIVAAKPKVGKTWLIIDFLVSLLTGTLFLQKFKVLPQNSVLVFCAEDSPGSIKRRVSAVAKSRGLDEKILGIFKYIDAARIDLSDPVDLARFKATIVEHNPKAVVLDPLRRVISVDENSSKSVGEVLSKLRELQRLHKVAIILTHHMGKKVSNSGQMGDLFRGSSDFHSFGDFNIYLTPEKSSPGVIKMTFELRDGKPHNPIFIKMTEQNSGHSFSEISDYRTKSELIGGRDLEQEILISLSKTEMSGNQVVDELGGNRNEILKTIKNLTATGQLIRRGKKYFTAPLSETADEDYETNGLQ